MHHNELDEVKVMAIAAKNPQTVNPDMALAKAIDKMLREKIHSVIVTADGGKPVGIVSSLDIVKTAFLGSEKAKDLPISKLIEGQKLLFVYDEMSVRDALNLMVDKNVRSLPILDMEENLEGIITMSDIAKFVRKKL